MTLPKTIRLLSDTIAGILQDPIKDQQARVWSQKVLISTYSTGEKEKNPMFLEKRVYQGSSGVVYPYPVIEKISDVKTNQEWNALFLENPYLLIMILPELGGRIQMAYDKLKNRHFVYFNKEKNPEKARLSLEKAFSLDRSDARIGMELDQLYKRLNLNPELRWAFLEENHTLVEKRDDLFLEKVTLLNLKGRYEEAYRNIMSRKFHPWEGGEGIVSEQYVWCLTKLAKKAIQSGHFPEALRNNLYHKGAHIQFNDLNTSFSHPHLEG